MIVDDPRQLKCIVEIGRPHRGTLAGLRARHFIEVHTDMSLAGQIPGMQCRRDHHRRYAKDAAAACHGPNPGPL